MRMWLVDPKFMCNQHLLGEHVEMHAFIGTIKKGISIKGYITKGLVEPEKIQERHDELVLEMKSRGMKHNSPMFTNITFWNGDKGYVNIQVNLTELSNRCEKCRKRIGEITKNENVFYEHLTILLFSNQGQKFNIKSNYITINHHSL